MKLVAQVKLLPSPEQRDALRKTLEAANQAANRVSEGAFASKTFKRFDLHHQWYETIRTGTGLTAQIVALLFAKVADAYKRDRLTQRSPCTALVAPRTFRPHGAISYDSRILRYMLDKKKVSIWTVTGVETAVSLGKALALEDLSGIRERGNGFSKEMRFELGNWSFDQLKQFVLYKARRAGVPVVLVDPRNSSRTCSVCGYCAKHNRVSPSVFKCKHCGLERNADLNAAVNLSGHGAFVTRPKDGMIASASLLSKPPALAGG